MWVFVAVSALLVYSGLALYAGFGVLEALRLFAPGLSAFAFLPPFVALCYSFILVYLLRLDRVKILRRAAPYSFPLAIYFCMSLFALDASFWALGLFARLPVELRPELFSAARAAAALCLTLATIAGGNFHARKIKTVRYAIKIGKPAGRSLRIALIADLHIDEDTDRLRLAQMVDAVNSAAPDIICIAGDIFDEDMAKFPGKEEKAREFRRFSAPLGVYAVGGNHDVDTHRFKGEAPTALIKNFLENAGIVFLQDEAHLVAGSFYLVGRRDASPIGGGRAGAGARKTAAELAAGLDKSLPVIFMDHQPADFKKTEEAGADLILCGHTHGGQFFPGNIITACLFRRGGAVNYGYWKGQSAQGIVTSGIGVWGPLFRTGSNSEVAVIDLQFNA